MPSCHHAIIISHHAAPAQHLRTRYHLQTKTTSVDLYIGNGEVITINTATKTYVTLEIVLVRLIVVVAINLLQIVVVYVISSNQ